MMNRLKKNLWFWVLLFSVTVAVLSCETEATVDPVYKEYFIKYYGGDGNQVAKDFVIDEENEFITMVGTSIEPEGGRRIYLVKADFTGRVIWAKKLGTDRETARDIEIFNGGQFNGKYMILTNTRKVDSDSTDIKVLVVNSDGKAIDSTSYFNKYPTQFAYSLTPVSDGGFVIAGNADSIALDDIDPRYDDQKDNLSLRYGQGLNDFGDLWLSSFGGEPYAMGVKIIQPSSSVTNFLFAGSSNGYLPATAEGPDNNLDMNFYFRYLDGTGFPPGTAFYSGHPRSSEVLAGIARSASGTYMAAGTQTDTDGSFLYVCNFSGSFAPSSDFIIDGGRITHKSIADLNINWQCVGITPSKEQNKFWVLGNVSRSAGQNIWVSKTNTNNDSEIDFEFGGTNNDDTGSAIKELSNGDLLILGTMELVNQTKMALIKVRPNGSFK
jgi:hypothetical protein